MRTRAVLGFLLLAACGSTERHLKDLTWGQPVAGEKDPLVDRARRIILQEFPRGFDPDRDDSKGEFWTVWHYAPDPFYRNTRRTRARLVVEEQGKGKCRVGVAIVYQINDNIDNPDVIDEGRWVKPTRDYEREERIERRIAQRYKEFEPSEAYEQKQKSREERQRSVRQDIIDRNKDVNLEDASEIQPDREVPRVAGQETEGGKKKP